MNNQQPMTVKYVYPLLFEVVLGSNKYIELIIEPDIPILVERLRSNCPETGMFYIEESDLMYAHDAYMVQELPLKSKKLIIRKNGLQKVEINYTGFIPKGFCCGMSYRFNYSFIGNQGIA